MIAWVLVGGRVRVTPEVARVRAERPPALVVAADGGARHAGALGVQVDAWVGDFDSSAGVDLNVPREVHPRAKDLTDAELAVQVARARGATSAVVWGAFGGRFDHALALALTAVRASAAGFPIALHSGDESGVPLLPGAPVQVRSRVGQVLSVVALDDLSGLTLSGVRWPLQRADVPCGSGWTLSNEAHADAVRAQVQRGRALLLQRWDDVGVVP
ncbi:thiamine diphosphokinase [Deinococcus maricopensis]|uniref:Thiamine diphosphokinase n=1 Tax=Deinococcus maricopensis (strain DSM 21211 / LMG 22137 / NRRL B-23946 / LB-34) TaxID=709986 RepID=E8U6I0_DEIML|nr:thiamine diphosphokinase [Deinococcus maricopensis]ADV66669.1 thiamine pyrophosphokinase [Deinococcus maricopensis DSM 21211]